MIDVWINIGSGWIIFKKSAEGLNYDGIEFPVQEKDFNKIEKTNNISINVFVTINWFFQFVFQIKNFKIQWIYYF